MSVQQYCLRWNNHQPNFISVFSSLLHNETLVDVTLAAEGRQLQAHKVVLSACSSYFQSLFTSNPCQHPIVILKDVQYNDLKTMVDFMYYGEVNVSTEQLPQILKTAEMLKIKGLAEMPESGTVTKSESKSSDHTESTQAGSGSDSIWGSTESQQYHHQQQQQQAAQQQHQQQQQQPQQQQQQIQTLGRRTPSPLASSSPSTTTTRRKRMRKSSSGSGSQSTERIILEQEQANMDTQHMNMQQQIETMSFQAAQQQQQQQQQATMQANMNSQRIMKDNSTIDDSQQHESSQESVEEVVPTHHISAHIMKSEHDLTGVTQTMPIDISGSSSLPQSQAHHTATVQIVASAMNTSQIAASPTLTASTASALTMGSKRGRLLTRQPRVKKDLDQSIGPSTSHTLTETFETGEVLTTGQQCWLTVPTSSTQHHIIERHASDPTPTGQQSSTQQQHMLHVPQTSYLTKQYSHPLLPSQSHALSEQAQQFKLIRQLSHPIQSSSTGVTTFVTAASTIAQLVSSSMKTEPEVVLAASSSSSGGGGGHMNPAVVIVPDLSVHVSSELPTIRVKSEELQRSISTPQSLSREPSLDSPRSSHCPVVRPGPALGCNFCWNTIDAHGRILRRKTKYHCPECQTNLCIVPCFQEYHERQTADNPQPVNENKVTSLKHYSKSGSL